jgi:phosphopantothenoylcysteine decarboxylase/phosphopantothenate--cysteine ligase
MLKGKKIILGITGSIAAYKAAMLIRLLIKEQAEVKVIMTKLAREFITPLTMATLSGNRVMVDFFNPENGEWNNHVKLGLWADAFVIAPATANTIGKMAGGIADNLLLTTYLSAKCPVFIAPAMDKNMYSHKTTKKNLQTLQNTGNIILEAAIGELASGLEGKGRMEEPENIVNELKNYFKKSTLKKKLHDRLVNKNILITAGPTRENIDPVRYISNYSSGKMGFALAEELANLGAKVTLISGPTDLLLNHPNIKIINVVDADEMYKQSRIRFKNMHGAILAAAVADYKPKKASGKKIKGSGKKLILELAPTIDIAQELGRIKNKSQFLAGFALESENEIENARSKLKKKNFDFIVLNSVKDKGAGFQYDTNKISIIDKNNKLTNFKLKSKKEVAKDIINKIAEII